MNNFQISDKMREDLRKPFPPDAYSSHSAKKFLTTIKAMYIIERLNDVFGIGRWNLEHEIISNENGYVLLKGSLKLTDYPGVIIPTQYGGHKTTGTGTELADGFKSAITDCITKSASYLEIGIDVFKGKIKPPGDGKGKSNAKDQPEEPKLPWLNPGTQNWQSAIKALADGKTIDDILKHCRLSKANQELLLSEVI